MNSKKGQVTIYLSGIIIAFIVLVITAVIAPTGALFTSEAYVAGEKILEKANDSIQNIQNDTIRDSVMGVVGEAREATEMNIEVTTDIFRYSWVIILVLVGIVLFLYSRQIVEYGRSGGII